MKYPKLADLVADTTIRLTSNPGAYNAELGDAEEKYEEFHRYKPTKIGEFHPDFRIPTKMIKAGRAKYVTYRSAKVDPATLKKPRRPVDYIHEHDAGVVCYLKDGGAARQFGLTEVVTVPEEFATATALTCLGINLGFAFRIEGDDEDTEAETTDPMPELYCVPSGKCLLVVQSKRKVIAMVWGGGLGVHPRGIDG